MLTKELIFFGGIESCTSSKKMANDLVRLFLREGIILSIRSKKCDEIQTLGDLSIRKKGWFYTASILGGQSLRLFARNVNPVRKNISKIK